MIQSLFFQVLVRLIGIRILHRFEHIQADRFEYDNRKFYRVISGIFASQIGKRHSPKFRGLY
jgi:hypothetical protein